MLPVLKKGRLVGVVTDRDLKRASASDATSLEVHELLFFDPGGSADSIQIRKKGWHSDDNLGLVRRVQLLEDFVKGVLPGGIRQYQVLRASILYFQRGHFFSNPVRFNKCPQALKDLQRLL